MIQPKTKFLQDVANKGWQSVADSALFNRAAEAALAQMALQQQSPADMGTAAAQQFKIQGAKEFLSIFMSLQLEPEVKKLISSGNLKH